MMSFEPSEFTGTGFDAVVRQLPAAVMIVDGRSRAIVYSNARARQMTEDQLGRAIPPRLTDDWEIFHPDGRLYTVGEWPLVRSLTAGEQVIDEEYFNVLPDGDRLFVRCSSAAIHDGDGRIVAAALVMTDVTEQKGQEERLRYLAGLLDNTEDAIVALDAGWVLTVWNKGAERMYGWTADEVVGRHTLEVAHLEMGDEERAGVRREVAERGRWRGEVVAHRKDGTAVRVELITVAVRGQRGEITGYLGIHRDATDRRRAEMGRRAEQQAVVAQLGQRALAGDDLQALLDEAVGVVAGTLDVELVGVAEVSPGSGEIVFRAGVGWREGAVGSPIEPMERDSLMGYTLRVCEPVIVEDMAAEARFAASAIARDHRAVSALSVMIAGPGEPFGTLAVLSTSRRPFSPSEVSFVQAVANVLASAVERRRGQERLVEVRGAERRRIARDLHDEALQDLTHALSLAGAVPTADRVTDLAEELAAALQRVGEQLRGAIFDLRLGGEDNTPFPELLEALVTVHRAMAVGYEIELEMREGVPAGPLGATGIEVLRIVGEALTNARRHARAARVSVRAWGSEGRLHAEVADDGHGFDPAAGPPGVAGHGLKGMRERAERAHGRLDILTDPAAGTTVRVDVPLDASGEGSVEQVRVLIVEDHTAVLQAIAGMFEREADVTVVGQARSLAEAREQLHDVDVALLDLGLPDGDGTELIGELREASPGAQALVLSAGLDRVQTARAIEAGAAGALDKTAQLGQVVDAVRRLRAGETLLAPDEIVDLLRLAGRRREQESEDRRAIESLTPREREVLQALAAGLDNHAIAVRLDISIRTARNHVAAILTKLGVHSQLQAVLFALRYGVIDEL